MTPHGSNLAARADAHSGSPLSPKDKFKRISGYARISKRVTDWYKTVTWKHSAGLPSSLHAAENFAWERLPENVRRNLAAR